VPFTIPNVGSALFSHQAFVNSTDLDIIAAGISGDGGVSTGCAVTTTGTGNGSVTVASGTVLVSGVYVQVAGGNVAISSNSSGNPRRDLVTIDSAGTKSTVVGTPGAAPLMPAITAGRTVLADVYVPNGHSGSSTIAAGAITDKRIVVASSDFQGHNVLQYGAIGNSHHNTGGGADDTAAFQAAYDAAQSVGGFGVVVIPGGRSYRITDTIETCPDPSKAAVWTWGVGSMGGNQTVGLPNVVWDGAAAGTMMNAQASGNNVPNALFRNVRFSGRNIANTGIRFGPSAANTPKIDSGTGLDEVWFAQFAGNAIQCDGIGATNFWIRGGRWDRIAGYGLYMKVESQTLLSIRDVTWDATDVTLDDFAKGMVHFDAAAGGDTAYVMCHFDSVHPESGGLSETNASGTTAADKRGIVACTISSPIVNRIQFHLTFTNIQCLGYAGGDDSHSLVQMLGGPGSTEADREAERAQRLVINGRMIRGFSGDGTAAQGHLIPIGGVPAAANPQLGFGGTVPGHYTNLVHAMTTGGTVFGTERPKSWSYTA
jgi:hypothetical protein